MTRLSDALRKTRSSTPGTGATPDTSPEDVVVASDDSVVVVPWLLERDSDWSAAERADTTFASHALIAPSFGMERELELLPPPRRRFARYAAIVAVLVLGGAVAYVLFGRGDAAGASQAFEVQRGDLRQIVAARGKVEPGAEIAVTAKMIGRIKAMHVREGDLVRRGQLIAEMDDDDLRAQLAQAVAVRTESQARLAEVLAGARSQERETALARIAEATSVRDEARSALGRQQKLAETGLISAAQLDEALGKTRVAEAQLRSAQEGSSLLDAGAREETRAIAQAQVARTHADVSYAEAQLANAQVRAPVDGRVLRVYMHPGEVIVLQRPQPIAVVGAGRTIYVRAEIDESDLNKVQLGQSALIRSDVYTERTFPGRIVEIAPAVGRKMLRSDDPAEMLDTKVLETRIELADADLALGLTVDVEIAVVTRQDVPVVPLRAVRWDGSAPHVEVRSGNATEDRRIAVGARDDEFIEVQDGLRQGEVVLVRP